MMASRTKGWIAVSLSLAVITLKVVPVQATQCFGPRFVTMQLRALMKPPVLIPLPEIERQARKDAIDDVQRYPIMFWGRPIRWQCFNRGKRSALVEEFEVANWVKGGSGTSAHLLKVKPAGVIDWQGRCRGGKDNGINTGQSISLYVGLPVRPEHYKEGYPKTVLDKVNGYGDAFCPMAIEEIMAGDPYWSKYAGPATRSLLEIYRKTVHDEIDKLK